jgi:cysteine desulfurase
MERLYFDYNASAPHCPGLKDYLMQCCDKDLKNPSSVHQEGQTARAFIETARKEVKAALGVCSKHQLVFTSGGTESNNAIISSHFQEKNNKNKYLLSKVEHASVYNMAKNIEKMGIEVDWIRVSANGEVDLEDYAQKLDDRVGLVSVMLANNETGFILPVQEMATLAQKKGIPFHTDAVCAAGKIPFVFNDLNVDYLSFSSHKFGGLKGVGGIVVHERATFQPLIFGGPQEAEKRAGTENILGIGSTAFALQFQVTGLESEIKRQDKLRERLKQGILELYPQVKFAESKQGLSQTLNAAFVGLNGNLLLTNLDLEGVSASYGSACASGSLEVSHVLINIGLNIEEARSAIRFSFGRLTDEKAIDELLLRLKKVLERMK